jgi:hypothetical protein
VTRDPSDPGARLLVRIGDFIEPLTRFDRTHLTMSESRHETVSVLARQVFRAVFEINRTEGDGPLLPGIEPVADAIALTRQSEAQLASARAQAPEKLSGWAEEHGEDPLARPRPTDCFTAPPPLGFSADCPTCEAAGMIACAQCKGTTTLPCETCNGRGSKNCVACSAKGKVECQNCAGAGTTMARRERKVWDEAIEQNRIEYYQESAPCDACGGAGNSACSACGGSGQLACKACDGSGATTCKRCSGEGTETCPTCHGAAKRHAIVTLACSIRETFEVAARTSDAEIARVLKSQGAIEDILRLSSSHRASAEASNDTLTRDTVADTPVTSVAITAGKGRAIVRAYGPGQEVLDFKNLAGMLLADDVAELEAALKGTRLVPPKVTGELYPALSNVLASEANARIARSGSRLSADEMQTELRGVVSSEHVTRAGAAIRKGVNRTYWAAMARGGAAVLLLPLSFAVIDLAVRGAGGAARVLAILGVMLATFGVAAAAHLWIVRQLQRRIAPDRVPRMGPIVDRSGPTTVWLVTAGVAAVVLTLFVAAITSALFPPN